MNEKNEIKLKFSTVVVLIILITVLAVVAIFGVVYIIATEKKLESISQIDNIKEEQKNIVQEPINENLDNEEENLLNQLEK